MPAPTTLLRLAARRAAPAISPRGPAAPLPRARHFQSAAHQENKLRLQGKEAQEAAEHDTLHENKEYLEHEKNLRPIWTALRGRALLNEPSLNKGAGFTFEERDTFGLFGLLPYEVHSLEQQCKRAYSQLQERPSAIAKYTFLSSLRDQNIVLFYSLCLRYLNELLPVIYTPTVGEAIQKYSTIWRRPDGLFLSYQHRNKMREMMLQAKRPKDVDLIVVTDSEGILGIGDQGVGGILISMGKANIYTLGGGIDPSRILPVVLDVGTDNPALLNDPLYLGMRRKRIRGPEYDQFVDAFCDFVREEYPQAMLHFEDFGVNSAGRLLQKFRPKQSCFNDDMQGTAAVVLSALVSAVKVTKSELKDQRIIIYGLGTAGLGIADGIRSALMIEAGLTSEEVRKLFWCVDRPGLLTSEHAAALRPGQEHFIRDAEECADWERDGEKGISLLETVRRAKPTIMIGCSTMSGAFNEEVVREMAKHVERPIIFPLSNPTKLAEADPADVNDWTNGKALMATGSPFPPVRNPNGKEHQVAMCNNALVYPGFGLGVIISRASQLTDKMITAGVAALAKLAPALEDPDESLLPGLHDLRHISVKVAVAVANAAKEEGVSQIQREDDYTEEEVRNYQWDPVYRPLELVDV
ncbi:NAD-dependent malic enzyme, mitochondrial [Rhodotorula kratochvilovae]